MAFSNYRITALMLFYVAFAASGVEAEVIRQHLTVGENENAIALTAAEGADQDRRFWCFMGRGVRRHANFALALANSGLDAYLVRYFRRGSNPLCNCWDAWTKTVSSATTAILRRPETSVASVCSASGPLHGVPFTVKENIDMAGLPTTWGVPALAQAVVPTDAPVVERMRAAGAIPIGRTNLLDMALRPPTISFTGWAVRPNS
jgi:hypothetical protein